MDALLSYFSFIKCPKLPNSSILSKKVKFEVTQNFIIKAIDIKSYVKKIRHADLGYEVFLNSTDPPPPSDTTRRRKSSCQSHRETARYFFSPRGSSGHFGQYWDYMSVMAIL